MPIYKVKEKYWWWSAYYTIQDDKGNNAYSLHRKWFAMDQAIEMRDEQPSSPPGEIEEDAPPNPQTALTIRKKLISLGPVHEVVRNDNVVVASIKSKRVQWFGQQRHVFELADVEYVVDESKWKNKSFSIQPTKGRGRAKEEIALVYKKRFDLSGAFWVDVKVDPTYYEGEALKDMCGTVLAACIIMIEILNESDRQAIIRQQQEEKEKRQSAGGT